MNLWSFHFEEREREEQWKGSERSNTNVQKHRLTSTQETAAGARKGDGHEHSCVPSPPHEERGTKSAGTEQTMTIRHAANSAPELAPWNWRCGKSDGFREGLSSSRKRMPLVAPK